MTKCSLCPSAALVSVSGTSVVTVECYVGEKELRNTLFF